MGGENGRLLENLWSEAPSDAGLASRHRSRVSMLAPEDPASNIEQLSDMNHRKVVYQSKKG
jgi:hypothetical protein